MNQLSFAVDAIEFDVTGADSSGLIFLDDANYEFVGGGDAVNGY